MTETLLVQYGSVAEVDRFQSTFTETPPHGSEVIVNTRRGLEIGRLLSETRSSEETKESALFLIERFANNDDLQLQKEHQAECEATFEAWQQRIIKWNLAVELIDLEWMLDKSKLVLYVLNDRGPDCTKLALYAMADNLGTIEVQPVDQGGMVELPTAGGGCSSGGCGSGGCGSR